jgi:chromosome segregation ATPase
VEKLHDSPGPAPAIAFNELVVESASRIEIPRILEQLKKISDLKTDNLAQISGSKLAHTAQEMFSIIGELEGQLRDVLSLNAALRAEERDQRKEKEKLQREKEALEQKIAALEHDVPRVQDLEKRLEIAVEEVEKFRGLYRREKEELEKIEANIKMMASLVDKAREERDDAYREIVVMEDKLKSLTPADH